MKRRHFLATTPALLAGKPAPKAEGFEKPKDYRKEPFRRMVILGESTVEGGGWLLHKEDRYADVVARLINSCQDEPMEYINKGIGANAISPRSPGYANSRKPSAMERYQKDVIEQKPDLFVLCYGLNDMRAGMPLADFRADMAKIIGDVKQACSPMTVLATIYYMTGWKSWPSYDKGSVELTLKFNDAIRSLAREFDCVLADAWGSEGGADWLIHPDGVHANRIGNLLLGHRVFEAIAQHASGLTNREFALNRETRWTKHTTTSREKDGNPWRKTW
ncbi:MAG: SGNH/GDSL hydrolase family protein [Acidobacteria bacterium]|nr:SGNH/GDSL hydrolase family protein [Acidobacteriota bacterium]